MQNIWIPGVLNSRKIACLSKKGVRLSYPSREDRGLGDGNSKKKPRDLNGPGAIQFLKLMTSYGVTLAK